MSGAVDFPHYMRGRDNAGAERHPCACVVSTALARESQRVQVFLTCRPQMYWQSEDVLCGAFSCHFSAEYSNTTYCTSVLPFTMLPALEYGGVTQL